MKTVYDYFISLFWEGGSLGPYVLSRGIPTTSCIFCIIFLLSTKISSSFLKYFLKKIGVVLQQRQQHLQLQHRPRVIHVITHQPQVVKVLRRVKVHELVLEMHRSFQVAVVIVIVEKNLLCQQRLQCEF